MTDRRRATRLWAPALAAAASLSAIAGKARAAGGSHYGGDLGQALAAMGVFLVLLLILGKYAWRPIVQQLKKREEAIQKTIERAERTQKKAEELLAGYEEKMAAAESQVSVAPPTSEVRPYPFAPASKCERIWSSVRATFQTARLSR